MIYIGGSCVGFGSTTPDTTVNEIRFVRDDRHDPIAWNTVDMSIANNIKMLLTVDSYLTSGRGWGSDEVLANFTQECIDKYKSKTNRKSLWILDNEADEIYPLSVYIHYLDVFQRVVRRNGFEVGAGNFQFRKDYYYGLVFRKDLYDVMGIHLQNGFETASKIETNGNWYKHLKDTYELRMTCTEAVPTGWNLNDHYPLVIKQLQKSIDIGLEDFCVIFIKGGKPEQLDKYRQLTFTEHPVIWSNFKRVITDNTPIPIIIEDDDMKLDVLKVGSKGNQVKWLQKILDIEYGFENEGEWDGIFGSMTEAQVKEYQTNMELAVDGIVGKNTMTKLINEATVSSHWYNQLVIFMAYE